jgi:hypothetical protein
LSKFRKRIDKWVFIWTSQAYIIIYLFMVFFFVFV